MAQSSDFLCFGALNVGLGAASTRAHTLASVACVCAAIAAIIASELTVTVGPDSWQGCWLTSFDMTFSFPSIVENTDRTKAAEERFWVLMLLAGSICKGFVIHQSFAIVACFWECPKRLDLCCILLVLMLKNDQSLNQMIYKKHSALSWC